VTLFSPVVLRGTNDTLQFYINYFCLSRTPMWSWSGNFELRSSDFRRCFQNTGYKLQLPTLCSTYCKQTEDLKLSDVYINMSSCSSLFSDLVYFLCLLPSSRFFSRCFGGTHPNKLNVDIIALIHYRALYCLDRLRTGLRLENM